MENTENTTPTPADDATAAPAPEAPAPEAPAPTSAEAQDPNVIGKLTPEEQQALMRIRQESQQLLAKVGEHELLKSRLLARIDELEQKGQGHINEVSKRLGIEDGQQWAAMQDGTIRLIAQTPVSQSGEGGAGAPPG